MAFWEFFDYITTDHKCPILDWWGAQEGDVRAAFEIHVKLLGETEDWETLEPRQHEVLSGNHAGMCELKFKVEGIGKFRPLGLWRPMQREFIFFGACRKQMKPFSTIPPDAFDDAHKLMRRFENGEGDIRKHV
jgi:hypothetical protein